MNFSFWETYSWFSNIDYCIIGSGITGLNCALRIKKQQPNSKVIIIEKGMLPEGASTKNAGFACFGSISEILNDLNTHSKDEVYTLVEKRVKGLELLRKNFGDEMIDYQHLGGYELFANADVQLYRECLEKIPEVNKLLYPVFKEDIFTIIENGFGFRQIQPKLIYNKFEGQIDTGRMMTALVKKAVERGIRILNNVEVNTYTELEERISIATDKFNFQTRKLIICTNGFASRLNIYGVKPARAQVLITKPLNYIPFKGTFHLDRGYYYFRNIGNRVLFGGGRNLDFKSEETDKIGLTDIIQNKLKELLCNCVLPNIDFEIEQSWSGIMGVGNKKKPMIKKISNNVYCGVRLGGMGIAIGSLVGRETADLVMRA